MAIDPSRIVASKAGSRPSRKLIEMDIDVGGVVTSADLDDTMSPGKAAAAEACFRACGQRHEEHVGDVYERVHAYVHRYSRPICRGLMNADLNGSDCAGDREEADMKEVDANVGALAETCTSANKEDLVDAGEPLIGYPLAWLPRLAHWKLRDVLGRRDEEWGRNRNATRFRVIGQTDDEEIDIADVTCFEAALIAEGLKEKVRAVLDCLEPLTRNALVLYFGLPDGASLSPGEVAEALGISLGRAKRLISGGLKDMRLRLDLMHVLG